MADEKIQCQKCRKMLKEINFYTYKDGRKTEMCKGCLTMHIDNFNPETFVWLLEKMDVPYVPGEWNSLRDKAYEKDPVKMNGMSVFGKYLSKMKLKQWKEYGWADTERLSAEALAREEENAKMDAERAEMLTEQFKNGDISEAEYKTLTSTLAQNENYMSGATTAQLAHLNQDNPYDESRFLSEEDMPDPGAELTDEDKIYLAMKWGRLYTPGEWVLLEQKYTEMTSCFDIQDSDTISTLKLICKTDLKMNQALDSGDIDSFQKLSKVSESLRKSAKFTALQNKEEQNNFISSIGEMVALCEREEGFIPRFCTDIPQDKVDITLQDMNNYVKRLVTEDLGFGAQIETALKKIELQRQENQTSVEDSIEEIEKELDGETEILMNEDYQEFYNLVAEWSAQDAEVADQED